MKKILLVICCLLMCGCQKNSETSTVNTLSEKKENIILKQWRYLMNDGDGNNNGYYHFVRRESDEGTIINLCYYDYETKKEVFLCDKAQCQHIDPTCSSYLEGVDFLSEVFVYKDHVYIIEMGGGYAINSLGEYQRTPSRLFQMDLDGKNRKVIAQLEEGYEFEASALLIADDILYAHIIKNDRVEVEKDSYLQISVESDLYAFDLTNGQQHKLCSMKNQSIVGANGRNIIIQKINYKDDPDQYLAKKDYQGYDKAMLNYTTSYIKFSIDTCEESKEIQSPDYDDMSGVYYQNKIYWLNDGALIALDLDSGEEKKLYESSNLKDLTLDYIIDDHIILEKWIEDQLDGHSQIYTLSLDHFQFKENTLHKSITLEPINILSETEDYFLVNYDHDAKKEISWAGTDQYNITNKKYALIKKEDYFQNQGNYEKIQLLDIERED